MTAYYGCTAEIHLPKPTPEMEDAINELGKLVKWASDANIEQTTADDGTAWMNLQFPEQNCGHGFIRELDISLNGSSSHAGNNGRHGRWTEEAIYILHEEVLKRTVHVLNDKRASKQTKESVLDWISKDEYKPFSFRICAIVSGCDPEKLRDQIFDLVRRLKRRRMTA